ncbi:MAG: Asp-tRNA(Asn)/Glu-tRNA(Gln) amidotransferase subunit GatA [Phycisphaerales bacterium]|nr:Asp-tRNA(Asn)/Glu-tRNA(Gln) amidotransferase subunit GatA [Phycisphaerales bacterium]
MAQSVRSGAVTATARVEACLTRIEARGAELHAFNEVLASDARAAAARVDAAIQRGENPGSLAGVILAIKDNIATTIGHTTCSSRFLENYRSPFDATVIGRLQSQGAIVIGKTNLDEFAMGSSTENSAFGATRNPWDSSRVPGGSSGGSAAAVSASFCDAALGSDTGGSIRQPASLCGCVGFKPTYGRVSRYGLVAFGSSLDQIGPFARDVRGCAELFEAMAGRDPLDSTTADLEVPDCLTQLDEPLRGLRVGIPREYRSEANAPSVARVLEDAISAYQSLGATIVDVELPLTDIGISTYYVIAPAEASSNLARFDGIRYGKRAEMSAGDGLEELYAKSRSEGFGPEVQRRIMLGTYVLSSGYYDAYYNRALQVRRQIREEFDHAFTKCDVLLGPTSPIPAFEIGGKSDPWAMYLCDVYTVNTNIAGIPGISLNAGFAQEGGATLPIGMQLQAPAFSEALLLRAARMLEIARPPCYPA